MRYLEFVKGSTDTGNTEGQEPDIDQLDGIDNIEHDKDTSAKDVATWDWSPLWNHHWVRSHKGPWEEGCQDGNRKDWRKGCKERQPETVSLGRTGKYDQKVQTLHTVRKEQKVKVSSQHQLRPDHPKNLHRFSTTIDIHSQQIYQSGQQFDTQTRWPTRKRRMQSNDG